MTHIHVTNIYIAYIAIWPDRLFESKIEHALQVFSEWICMFSVIVLSQSMNIDPRDSEQSRPIINLFLVSLGLLLVLNVALVTWKTVVDFRRAAH